MAYAEQSDYIKWLAGRDGAMPLIDFDFWAARASEYVDALTFNRLRGAETIPPEVVATVCELAEVLRENDNSAPKGLSGMSIGNYSESYVKDDPKTVQNRISGVIRRGLGATGLLYRGVHGY